MHLTGPLNIAELRGDVPNEREHQQVGAVLGEAVQPGCGQALELGFGVEAEA